jgi:hypothetical protein
VTASAPTEILPISGVSGSSRPRSASARTSADAHAGLRAHGVLAELHDLVERSSVSTVVPPSPPTQRVCE